MSEYEILAIRYAHNAERRASENFMGGDVHNARMPMDFRVWVLRGGGRTIVVDTGFDAKMAQKRQRKITRRSPRAQSHRRRRLSRQGRDPDPHAL